MTMTRDEIMQLDDDALRLAVAKRSWLDGIIYPINTPNAIALLDSTGYEWEISVELYDHAGNGEKYSKPLYHVAIFGEDCDIEWDADTLANAACIAWLMWREAQR